MIIIGITKGGVKIFYRLCIRELRHLGKWLASIDPVVLVCIALIVLIVAVRFLPLNQVNSAGLGDQDKERITLIRLYYTYWNEDGIKKLVRLNVEQTQIQIPLADPVKTPIDPNLYREQESKNTWVAYKGYTKFTPFNSNIDPFQLDRMWRFVIDGDPPEWCTI
ncbi:hypothetical protein AGMMS49983_03280 [Clostridia bacterium]|nr:hypothetical protein AGMMS49983_03280 [Clostridia bacterium]